MNLGSMQRGILRNGGILGGQPPAAGPGTPADLAGPTIFTGRDVNFLQGENLTSQFLFGNSGQQGVQGHTVLIPADLSAETWESEFGNTISTLANSGSLPVVSSDGLYAYQTLEGDGTVGSANRVILVRWDMSDGSIDYAVALAEGGEGTGDSSFHVSLDEANDRLWVCTGAAGDELKEVVASTGASAGRTCNDGGLGDISGFAVSPNGDYLIAVSDAEYTAQWALGSLSGLGNLHDGYATDKLDFGIGGDTVYATTNQERLVGGGKVAKARDGTNRIWWCAGDSTANDPYIYCYDPETTPYTDRAVIEVDVAALVGHVGTAHVRDLAVDNLGNVYALFMPGTVSVDYEVVRLKPDGTLDQIFSDAGVTILDNTTYGDARRVAVSEDYVVAVGTDDGADGAIITYAQ